MSTITIRNVHEKTLLALKVRAAQHGHSTEAEIRAILEDAVRPKIGLGTELAALSQRFGGIDLDIQRDTRSPRTPYYRPGFRNRP